MKKIENILVIDRGKTSSLGAVEQLKLHGYNVDLLADCLEAKDWLPTHLCDAILLDFHVEDHCDIEFMTWLKSYKIEIPLIAMLEDLSVYEEARVFCEKSGKIPLLNKQFAALEAIDHLEQLKRAS